MTKEPVMNPLDLFNQVKEMIEKKDFDAAKKFVEDNKDKLGEYLDQAKKLVAGNEMAFQVFEISLGQLEQRLLEYLCSRLIIYPNGYKLFHLVEL